MQFACLFFEEDDSVCSAITIEAPLKPGAVERAKAIMQATSGAVGFQIWRDGAMVEEYFLEGRQRRSNAEQPFRPRVNNTIN